MEHKMNEARRSAFRVIDSQRARYGNTMRTFFEQDICERGVARSMEKLGWIKRFPGSGSRPGQIMLTDVGNWIASGVLPGVRLRSAGLA